MAETSTEEFEKLINAKNMEEHKNEILNNFNLTDTGNAEALAYLYADILRFNHRGGHWWFWDQSREKWMKDNTGEIIRNMILVIRERQVAAVAFEDDDRRRGAIRFALRSENNNRLYASIGLAKNIEPLSDAGTDWNLDPELFGVANGVVNLVTGELRKALPEDRITYNSEIAYDPNAKAPQWEKFLDEIFPGTPELRAYVQRAAGYSLTGDTKEQCIFLCHGGVSNGKSTFLNILRKIAGDYAQNTPFSTFERKAHRQNTNDVASLFSARLVTSSETSVNKQLDEERIKAITGGDPVTARFLHKEFFTYEPEYKIWLAVNELPKITGLDDGIWRRIRNIPFVASFGEEVIDKDLGKKLKKEAQGILAWAIQGAISWYRDGLMEPEIVKETTLDYRNVSNSIVQFLEEKVTRTGAGMVEKAYLYKAYSSWASIEGVSPVSRKEFDRQVMRQGIEAKKKSGQMRYMGIELLDLNKRL